MPRTRSFGRNLAIAAFKVLDNVSLTAAHYGRALELVPDDAKLLDESDQLAKGTELTPRYVWHGSGLDATLCQDDMTSPLNWWYC